MRKAILAVSAAIWLAAGAPAHANAAPPAAGEVEEIVVTARRSGIPVWRVTTPQTTLVLVGAIENVSKATRWNGDNLTEALRRADRVMFPQEQDYKMSPFATVGFVIKLLRASKLPKGQSLAQFMSPEQFARLQALQRKGVLSEGFERRNPLHLAIDLHIMAEGKTGLGRDAYDYTRKAIRKHKLKLVPLPKLNIKKSANAVLDAPPRAHIPCLLDSVAMIEAGPDALRARSDAWSDRRVTDALASPAQKAFETCSMNEYLERAPDWRATMRRVAREPQVTVAVIELAPLAEPGGLLDEFAAAGFDIQGPRWRR